MYDRPSKAVAFAVTDSSTKNATLGFNKKQVVPVHF